MAMLKKFFPQAFGAKDLPGLIVALIIYVVIGMVCGFVIGYLSRIPLMGVVFSLIGSLVGLYTFVGMVLSVLVYFKVIK